MAPKRKAHELERATDGVPSMSRGDSKENDKVTGQHNVLFCFCKNKDHWPQGYSTVGKLVLVNNMYV